MREVIFKELTSPESKKKNIVLKEVFEKDGFIGTTERRSFYFIKDIGRVDDENGLKKWIELQNEGRHAKMRHFHILKEHRDEDGEDKIVCKIAGTFYAIVDNRIYTIAFMNSFKVCFVKASLAK